MTNEVKFLQGSGLTASKITDAKTIYASTDKSVLGIGGKLYYGQPTIKYENEKITLYGVSGDTTTKLGEIDLTLDSFLEGATYIPDSSSAETAAYQWASGVSTSITQVQVTAAYTNAFGASFSGDKSAIVLIMHEERASGDSHSVIVLPLGKLLGDVQTEINNIEVGAGLNSNGTYSADTATTYISGATSLKNADKLLDTQIKANADAIKAATITAATFNDVTGKITTGTDGTSIALSADTSDIKVADDFTTTTYQSELSGATAIASGDTVSTAFNKVEKTISALTEELLKDEETEAAAIKALGNAAGIISTDGTIAYTANTSDTYISGATSLADADDKLDAAIKALATGATAAAISSPKKTIDITTAATGTTIDVNLDEKTITSNTNGELAVKVTDDSASAVHIGTGNSGVTVSLTLDTPNSAMTLSQSASGLKAEVKLNNSEVTDTNGGIELTQSTDGIAAKLYWGTF